MIRAAELFVEAEEMLVEVLGRIRGDDWRIMLPPTVAVPGHPAARRRTMRQAVVDHVREQLALPDVLAGANAVPEPATDPLGPDPQESLLRACAVACSAVGKVVDGAAIVHVPGGDRTTEEYLWQLDVPLAARRAALLARPRRGDVARLAGLPLPGEPGQGDVGADRARCRSVAGGGLVRRGAAADAGRRVVAGPVPAHGRSRPAPGGALTP